MWCLSDLSIVNVRLPFCSQIIYGKSLFLMFQSSLTSFDHTWCFPAFPRGAGWPFCFPWTGRVLHCSIRSGSLSWRKQVNYVGSFWTNWKPGWSNKSQKISPAFCMAHRTLFWDYNLMFAKDKPSGLEEGFHTHWRDLVLLNVYASEPRYLQVLTLIGFAFLWKSWLWFYVFDNLGVNIS